MFLVFLLIRKSYRIIELVQWFFVKLQSFRTQYILLLSLFSFLPGQPKSYWTIDLERLPYLRKGDVSLFIPRKGDVSLFIPKNSTNPISFPLKITELLTGTHFLFIAILQI